MVRNAIHQPSSSRGAWRGDTVKAAPPSCRGVPPPALAAQFAGGALAAAIAPIVQRFALAEVAAVALGTDQLDQRIPAELARQLPGRLFVPPHQRGVDHKAMIH